MKYEVIISPRAKTKIDEIIEYLDQEWSVKVRNNFKAQLSKQVNNLRQNPYMFPISEIKIGIRKCLVTKHNAMYYRIKANKIEIITIQDTRSDPKTLKL